MFVLILFICSVAHVYGAGDTTIPDTQSGALYNDPTIPKYERDSSCQISARNDLFRDCCRNIPGLPKECLDTCSYTGGKSFQSYIGQVFDRCGDFVSQVFACSTDDPTRALACCEGKLRIDEPNLRQPMPAKCLDICKGGAMTTDAYQAIFTTDREQPCWDFKTDLKSCLREFKFCDPANPPPQAATPFVENPGDVPAEDQPVEIVDATEPPNINIAESGDSPADGALQDPLIDWDLKTTDASVKLADVPEEEDQPADVVDATQPPGINLGGGGGLGPDVPEIPDIPGGGDIPVEDQPADVIDATQPPGINLGGGVGQGPDVPDVPVGGDLPLVDQPADVVDATEPPGIDLGGGGGAVPPGGDIDFPEDQPAPVVDATEPPGIDLGGGGGAVPPGGDIDFPEDQPSPVVDATEPPGVQLPGAPDFPPGGDIDLPEGQPTPVVDATEPPPVQFDDVPPAPPGGVFNIDDAPVVPEGAGGFCEAGFARDMDEDVCKEITCYC